MMTRGKAEPIVRPLAAACQQSQRPGKPRPEEWHENLALVAPSLLHVGRATCCEPGLTIIQISCQRAPRNLIRASLRNAHEPTKLHVQPADLHRRARRAPARSV